jgi:hypothetical protein
MIEKDKNDKDLKKSVEKSKIRTRKIGVVLLILGFSVFHGYLHINSPTILDRNTDDDSHLNSNLISSPNIQENIMSSDVSLMDELKSAPYSSNIQK